MNWVLTPDKIEALRKKGEFPPAPPENLSARTTLRETPESKLKIRLLPFLIKELDAVKSEIRACNSRLTSLQRPDMAKLIVPGHELEKTSPQEFEIKKDQITKEEDTLLGFKIEKECFDEALANLKTGQPMPPDFLIILHGIEERRAKWLSLIRKRYYADETDADFYKEAKEGLSEVAGLIDALEK
ncbi:MAG: hypothetical protein WC750_02590 [Patescibacteria group bacterium]